MIEYRIEKVIEVEDWDYLVDQTYGRVYSFQQQEGCRDRGRFYITIPTPSPNDFQNDTVPENIDTDVEGVSFKAWLERDPEQCFSTRVTVDGKWELTLWWQRNFYPDVHMVANDLYARGLIEAGEYTIYIDW